MVTLKLSNDNDRPLGVVSGFSISNFKLETRCLLYGGSGQLFLHYLFGDRCSQHISCKGLSLGARRGRWFLVCP